MTIKEKGVSAEAAQEPVGQVDPGDPNYERLQAIYVEQRSLNAAETIENAWRAFKVNREICGGDLVIICPPGRRRFAPRTNPHHLDQINYPNDSCHGCEKPLIPPEAPHGVDQHYYEGQEHIHTWHLYHPACWNTVYQEAVKQGAKALAALQLWEYLPPVRSATSGVAAPKPAGKQKPTRAKEAMRYRTVPKTGPRIDRKLTRTLLLNPELKANFGLPGNQVKAEIQRIIDHLLSRIFATVTGCGQGTIRGTYNKMRQEYLADLVAKDKAREMAPKAREKPPVPVTVQEDDDTPDPPEGFFPGFFRRAGEWLSR